MISGRQALAAIEDAIARLRGDEDRLDVALRSVTEEAARLRAERAEHFRALARVKLDALSREAVLGELDAAERRALALLASRREALEDLAGRRVKAEATVRAAEEARHAKAEALERAIDALGELQASLEARVRASPEWNAQHARVAEAAKVAEEAEKKAAQAEADREEKRKPYEADPLFMYLWKQRFGTAAYDAGPIVRFFDRKVARLVGYDTARANYAMLNEIPQRLREHAERRKAEWAEERARLATLERDALSKAGAAPLEAAIREAREALHEAEQKLSQAKVDLAAIDDERQALLVEGEDAAYREAVELLASADSRQDLRALYEEAARTATPEDDAILRRIEANERAIGEAEAEIGALRKQIQEQARRRSELEAERDEFRRRGYDRPRGRFGNEQILGQVLGGILGGVISSTVLRDVFRDGYQRPDMPWDPGFGHGGFPPPGGDRHDGGWESPWADITEGVFGNDAGSDRDGFGTGGSF